MKLETKNGVRTITLSKREQVILRESLVVIQDLDSIDEIEDGQSMCDGLQAIVVKFCEPAKSAT